jgi:tetratricopeptide (TPR) repeat protein
VKKAPGRARAHVSLAYGYLKEARYDEAIKRFREAVTIDPANSDYFNDLAYALLRAGKTEGSIDEAQKAIQLDPFNAMAYFNLGCSYEKSWQLQEALQSYSEALRLSLHPDIRPERRVDPAKASPKVESMKQMIRAMKERQQRG